jgi:hypothetical protein
VLKRQPDQVVWYRGGKQLLGGFPERIDIRRSVQAEQRPFDHGIDHQFAHHVQTLRGPFYLPRMLAQSLFVCASPRLRAFPQNLQQSGEQKYNLRYLAINKRCAKLKIQKKGKIANETPNQCAGQRLGFGRPAPG